MGGRNCLSDQIMFQTFDPYYQWLGIPPHLQPPNHYRLLGLELFESNPEVIGVAADRQMAHVRLYQLGAYSDLSQKLLNELASAKVCLLMPERKAAYDAELRKALAAQASASGVRAAGDSRWAMPVEVELDLAPDNPAATSPPHPAAPKAPPVSTVLPKRESPSSIGRKPSVAAAATKTPAVPSSQPVRLPAESPLPSAPWTNEPPYMAEYRRRFFESLFKFAIFFFLLIIGLILFYEFALPWLKESTPAPKENASPAQHEPVSRADIPPHANTAEPPLSSPPPPSNAEPPVKNDFSEKTASPPADELEEATPASFDKNAPAGKTQNQILKKNYYVGCWHIYEGGKYASSITLLRNNTARESRHPSLVGQWDYQNGEARILWKDGSARRLAARRRYDPENILLAR